MRIESQFGSRTVNKSATSAKKLLAQFSAYGDNINEAILTRTRAVEVPFQAANTAAEGFFNCRYLVGPDFLAFGKAKRKPRNNQYPL
jgi:hypothetical protein